MASAPTCGRGPWAGAEGNPSSAVGDARGEVDGHVGTVFGGRYEIESRLAEGAMGAVYRARHLTLGTYVAVKVLHGRLASNSALAQRFDREAEAQAQLDHPNCVPVLDAGVTQSGTKYLVMPLLAGEELREMIVGPMDLQRAVGLCLQLLDGLDHAHRRGFVHRDVKPENVLIVRTDDGQELAKLVDFGLVKTLQPDASSPALTEAGTVFGTPWYMSPEQAVGGQVDVRSDLYSLGAMMFEMLTGLPPFDAESFTILLRKHLLASVPRLPASVPPHVATVVYRLLEKEPKDRFQTAREASEALQRARSGAAEAVVPTSAAGELAFADSMGASSFMDTPGSPLSSFGDASSHDWVLRSSFGDERSESVLTRERAHGRVLGMLFGFAALAALAIGMVAVVRANGNAHSVRSGGGIAPVLSAGAIEHRYDPAGMVAEAEAPVDASRAEPRAEAAGGKPRAKARSKPRRRASTPARRVPRANVERKKTLRSRRPPRAR